MTHALRRGPMRLAPRTILSALALAVAAIFASAGPATAQDSTRSDTTIARPPLQIKKVSGPIVLDGDLTDAGWQGVPAVTQWFETNIGDNVEPQVNNVAWLAYDEDNFYAGFQFEDPDPKGVRAPLGDHDAISGSTDYGGIIVDSRNDGKSAQMFLANVRGVQYDALSNDATGEDNAPDYFWDAVGKKTDTGWNLEIRVPFSSLRYSSTDVPTWGIMLYRNYPRDRRYQFFSTRLPRDSNCFICNSSKLVGLSSLPRGSHLVIAPFATAGQVSLPAGGVPGNDLEAEDVDSEFGLDLKWNPSANAAIDATVNPDFSQIESDAAQIVANERFALFFPEKRPFFLEGVDLLSTILNVTYTRTITDPLGGLRATGRFGEKTAYTVLGTHDDGGGLVILPGPQGSRFALQDFESDVGVMRVRRDVGASYVSVLGNARLIDGGGHNVVFGPDFQWRPRPTEAITGQALWSDSHTPDRPDLAAEWDGRKLADHAFQLQWSHSTRHEDWFVAGQDIGDDFRADNGFIPQVGYREIYGEVGYTIWPESTFFNRVRFFSANYLDAEPDGDPLNRRVSIGTGANGALNSFIRLELNHDDIRVGDTMLSRFRPRLRLESTPSSLFSNMFADFFVGEEIDFDNAREGTGATILGGLTVRPTEHLELRGDFSWRWLDVDEGAPFAGRLFTAQVERLRSTYSFSARSFVRLIGQHVRTDREPALYTFPVPVRVTDVSFSGLLAYKLNWQTVMYLGYGDQRLFLESTADLEPARRSAFAKVSYAWQH
jgi:hypothetical protein